MRPSLGEVSVALYGAWRLMRFDPDGINYFQTTRDAFWKSFYAAVICLPGFVIVVLAANTGSAAPLGAILRYCLSFVAGLLIMAAIVQAVCEAIDRQKHFIRCIVAINWSSVLQIYLISPIFLFGAAAPELGISQFLLFCMTIFLMVYEGYIFHRSLEIAPLAAAGFVVLKFTVSLFLQSLISAS